MNINLEYYKIFYFVSKYGSVTVAAKELCISQPAVSQGVKQLEEGLGVILFQRNSKGMTLTAEGEALFYYISRGYEQIIQGEQKVKEMLDIESGEIRIGASDMTLQFYLLPYLEQYHSIYPRIKVNVTNAPTPSTIERLLEGKIDFGVVSTPFIEDSRIRVYKGRIIRDIFVAGERFSDLRNETLCYDKLSEFPLICLEENTSTRKYIDNFLSKKSVMINPEFELATSSIVVQFAVRNMGIGCVVEDFAKEEIRAGRLFKLNFEEEIPEREICVITDNRMPLSRAAEAMLELLK
ncbi:MAG: LysR family transcriptional regulator [Lachnospiraceae bacterium]|nr:LysR family transcriptional regulator [Lachnospiraceae bacterium]